MTPAAAVDLAVESPRSRYVELGSALRSGGAAMTVQSPVERRLAAAGWTEQR